MSAHYQAISNTENQNLQFPFRPSALSSITRGKMRQWGIRRHLSSYGFQNQFGRDSVKYF